MAEFGAPNTDLLDTEAMQAAKGEFDTCCIDYDADIAAVRATVQSILQSAWQGDYGPMQFENMHLDWDKNIVDTITIVKAVGTAVGLTSQGFRDLDVQARAAQREVVAAPNASGFN